MSAADSVLRADALRIAGSRLELSVHLPANGSLPLACLEAVRVLVDGVDAVDGDPVIRSAEAGGFRGRLTEAATSDARWDLRDPVVVELSTPAPEPGSEHDVLVELRCRIPYIEVAPGVPLVQPTRVSARLRAQH